MVKIMRHRQTKGPGTDRPDLTHRATSRLYRQNPSWTAHGGRQRLMSPAASSVGGLAGAIAGQRVDGKVGNDVVATMRTAQYAPI